MRPTQESVLPPGSSQDLCHPPQVSRRTLHRIALSGVTWPERVFVFLGQPRGVSVQ
jgi:hypothetical protein